MTGLGTDLSDELLRDPDTVIEHSALGATSR